MIKDKTRGSEREVGFANRLIEDDVRMANQRGGTDEWQDMTLWG